MANNVNVVNRGFEYICQWMSGTSATAQWTFPTYIGWGGANGYNAASVVLPAAAPTTTQGTGQWSDVGPFQEFTEARAAGVATVIGNTATSGTVTTQIIGTITAGSGESVGESFLSFTSSKNTAFTSFVNVNTTQSTFTATTSVGAGANAHYYQLNNEVIYVGTVSTSVLTISRAQNNSSAGTAKATDVFTMGNIPGAGGGNPSLGDMFAHAGFQALALNSGDSIQFTWQVGVTS